MRKYLLSILSLLLVGGISWAGYFYWKNLRGVWPSIQNSPDDITQQIPSTTPLGSEPGSPSSTSIPTNSTGLPLKLPPGFSISIFAKNLPGVRVMVKDSQGNYWVSQPSQGTVSLLDVQNGVVTQQKAIYKNLRYPHGLALDPAHPDMLYIAEEDKISRVSIYSPDTLHKIADLTTGGSHTTRTLGFGPDGKLYVSIGSTCNVCIESDNLRAKIFRMNSDGSQMEEYSRGLRNAVFFVWHPVTKQMFATEMGRDLLGDNIPPDEVNIIQQGKNYGWPTCYGKNIHDTEFDKNTYIRNPCMEPFEMPSTVDLQAHSAPLGLAFIPNGQSWPAEYAGNLIVAYHGSWNRSIPTGYKLVRIKQKPDGSFGAPEDFVTGWITSKGVLGRPVDVLAEPNGLLYVTDDKAGVIYRLSIDK
jgi:glucose/arabinose dehydrogenase